MDSLRLREGEAVELRIVDGCIEIRPIRLRYRLEDLVGQITTENQPEGFDSPPRGREAL